MKQLSNKLQSTDREAVQELKVLEYYYRSWFLPPHERFPILCMALDAVFGDTSQATQAFVEGVINTLDEEIRETQLKLLAKLRASVIHGGAPDVYDSSKYPKYCKRYWCDPIRDLELVVTECLRKKVFQGKLRECLYLGMDAIEKAQAKGILPQNIQPISIFNPIQWDRKSYYPQQFLFQLSSLELLVIFYEGDYHDRDTAEFRKRENILYELYECIHILDNESSYGPYRKLMYYSIALPKEAKNFLNHYINMSTHCTHLETAKLHDPVHSGSHINL